MGEKVGRVVFFEAAFPPPVRGGKEKQTWLLVRQLARMGVQIYVFSFGDAQPEDLETANVSVFRASRSLRGLTWLAYSIYRARVDRGVLHVTTPSFSGRFVAILGKLFGFKVFFKIPNEGIIERGTLLSRAAKFWTLKCCDRIIVLEEDSFQVIVDRGIDPSRILRVYNGVVRPIRACKLSGLSEGGGLKAVFAGRLVPQKRPFDAIELIGCAVSDGLKITLDVFGDGPLRSKMEEMIAQRSLSEQIHLHGMIPDLPERLREYDVLILTSDREGMPNVVLEAMAAGLPVIATNVGAVPEMLGDVGESWRFDPGDVPALYRILQRGANDKERLISYGQALRARAEAEFSIEAIAEKYLCEYEGAIT